MNIQRSAKLTLVIFLLALGCHKSPTGPTNPTGVNYNATGYPARISIFVFKESLVGLSAYAKLMLPGQDPLTDEPFAVASTVITDDQQYIHHKSANYYVANLAFSPQCLPYGYYDLYAFIDRDHSGSQAPTTGDLSYEYKNLYLNKELDHDVFDLALEETMAYPIITVDGKDDEPYWDHATYYWTLLEGDPAAGDAEDDDGYWDPADPGSGFFGLYDDLNYVRALWDADNIYLYINGEDTSDNMHTLVLIDWDSLIIFASDGKDSKSYFTGLGGGGEEWFSGRKPDGSSPKSCHRFFLFDESIQYVLDDGTNIHNGYTPLGVDYYIPLPFTPVPAPPASQTEAYYLLYSNILAQNGTSDPEPDDTLVAAGDWPWVARDTATDGVEIRIPKAGFIGSFDSQPGGSLRLVFLTASFTNIEPKSKNVYDTIPNSDPLTNTKPILEDNSGAVSVTTYIDKCLFLETDANDDDIPDRFW